MKTQKTSLLATIVLSGVLALCSPIVNAHAAITPGHALELAADTGKMKKTMMKKPAIMDKKKMAKMKPAKNKMGKMDDKRMKDTASKM
ncbi:hypothetical protein [Mucilaginibacter psychrotolerans]|uniref:Pentapeptide MXKDX repeat protein n=1 Tax=Mucilaginibacter psychrotolerans TaxID=1524096 RepID=A0A4Y8SC88_9SPHI|nr:hypothetical protein [Mucilaginibacter psychrotolerans]TFF36532.1 hypothetical protein E2R66_15355 [Mucilaginibacter psychrotolerans]